MPANTGGGGGPCLLGRGNQRSSPVARETSEENGARRVVKALKALTATDEKARAVIAATIGYNNLSRMNSYEYRNQGYHIGSGMAEAACAHRVGAGFKQSGMTNWTTTGAEVVLRVRVVIEKWHL